MVGICPGGICPGGPAGICPDTLYYYAFTIDDTCYKQGLDCMPLRDLCILATRPRYAVVCTDNMYKVIDVF